MTETYGDQALSAVVTPEAELLELLADVQPEVLDDEP